MSRWLQKADLLAPTLDEIKAFEPLLPPLALGWLLSLVATTAMRPLISDAFAANDLAVGSALNTWMWLAAFLAPLFQSARALLLAGVAWATLALANIECRFRSILSVMLYGDAILMTEAVALAAFLHLFGGEMGVPEDLRSPFGLAGLVSGGGPIVQAAAQTLTIFHGLWLLFLWFSFRRILVLPQAQSSLLVGALWGAVFAAAAVRAISLG